MTESITELIELLSLDEDNFCLAMIEFSGNPVMAYKSVYGDVPNASAKARDLMARPAIADRIKQLRSGVEESSLISMSCHLVELAMIRDQAKAQGAVKVALEAELSRGKMVGYYIAAEHASKAPPPAPQDNLERLANRIVSLTRNARQENQNGVQIIEDAQIVSTGQTSTQPPLS